MAPFMRWLAPSFVVLAVALPSAARADEHFVASLSVDDPTGCVDAAALGREVEQRLERKIFSALSPEAHLSVRVGSEGALSATVTMSRADGSVVGTRELAAAGDCGRTREALALVIALLVDVPAAEVRVAPPPPPPAPPPAAPPPAPPLSLLVEPRAELSAGALPSPAPGFGGAVIGQRGGLSAGLEAWAWPRSRSSFEAGRSATLSAFSAGLFGCGMPLSLARVAAGACLHLDAGRASASGQGFDDDRVDAASRLDLGLMLRGSVRLAGPIWLSAGAGAMLTPTPLQLVAEGADGQRRELVSGGRVWARGYLGVGVRFPSESP